MQRLCLRTISSRSVLLATRRGCNLARSAQVQVTRSHALPAFSRTSVALFSTEPSRKLFHGVVVGEIVEAKKHPNADSLTVCQVLVGLPTPSFPEGTVVQIVTGAPGMQQGQKVPVALVNSVLPQVPSKDDPSVRKDLKIKKSKLRGELSQGMICSSGELNVQFGDPNSIMFLEPQALVGQAFSDYIADKNIKVLLENASN